MVVACVACDGEFSFPDSVAIPDKGNLLRCPHCGRKNRLFPGGVMVLEPVGPESAERNSGRAMSPGAVRTEVPPAAEPPPEASIPRLVVSSSRGLKEYETVATALASQGCLGRGEQATLKHIEEKWHLEPHEVQDLLCRLGIKVGLESEDCGESGSEERTSAVAGLALGRNPQGFEEYRSEQDGSVLIQVPGGTFTMGSDERDNEKPPHRVSLESFLIGKYAVTNAQFGRFVSATGYRVTGDWQTFARDWGEQAPVVMVSWNDAQAYCQWAGCRLPTEAEWEYAARGPGSREYPWGNDWGPGRAWFGDNSGGQARSVGGLPAGASWCGAMDMAGNLCEWCSSLYKPYPYSASDGREDLSANGTRVYRGGSWGNSQDGCRSAVRSADAPDDVNFLVGLRCARSAP